MNTSLTDTTATTSLDGSYTITEAVVTAVADADGVSPLELPPLATVLDPDALETFVATMTSGPDEPMTTVEFAYNGYTVTVTGDGSVTVTELGTQE